MKGREAGPLGLAFELQGELRLEAELRAVAYLEVVGERRGAAEDRLQGAVEGERFAGGRVEPPAAVIQLHGNRPDVQRDALQDVGNRVGDRGDLRGRRIDVKRRAHDHGAEVEGTGDCWGDHGEGERRAFVWAGEVDVAGDVVGGGARPRAHGRGS